MRGEFAGCIAVYPLEDGTFGIETDRSEEAVDKFLALRKERKLGFDFETKGD